MLTSSQDLLLSNFYFDIVIIFTLISCNIISISSFYFALYFRFRFILHYILHYILDSYLSYFTLWMT